jgi:all-trans-retinol 13,14-reductase
MTTASSRARCSNPRGDLDAIVIGSGIGGLTAAALLARCAGKRVLVLERHYRAGGFTHTFERPGGFRWDVGVHYVGAEVERPGLERDALRVATGGALEWTRLPETFEHLVFPGFQFDIRAGRENFVADLTRAFPAEGGAIRAWLADVDRVCGLLPVRTMRGAVPAPVRWALDAATAGRRRLANMRTSEYLARRFDDPRLRAVVGARWGDYGLPPGESSFFAHAVITRHYLEGAVFPVGSAASIAKTMAKEIEAAGGEVRVRAEVERILVRRGRAIGVRLRSGEELLAPAVVSDAGARNTYLRLLPEDAPVPFREALRKEPPGTGVVTLFLGLSGSPAQLGTHGENLWFHDDLDADALWAMRHRLLDGVVPLVYVSFPSLKDPEARAHTAEIITPTDPALFDRWRDSRWMKRPEEYEAIKARISEAMLARVERDLPGFRALVVHQELSTPVTSAHFTNHPGGEIYGLPWRPGAFDAPWRGARTPVRGLYLAGADALFLGVLGSAMGGVAAALAVAGPGLIPRISRLARAITPAAAASTPAATSPSIA